MSIQHRLYFKSCFICQTNEEGKWGLEPYALASLVVINPIHRERNMLYLLLHPFRRMRATSPEGGSFAENKEKILKVKEIIDYTQETLSIVKSNVITRLFQNSRDSHLISYSDYSFQTLIVTMEFNIHSEIKIENIFENLDKLINPQRRTYTLKKVYLNFKPDVLELMETKYSKLLTLMKYQGAIIIKG